MSESDRDYFQQAIQWSENSDAEYPYWARVDQHHLNIRINDFPAETLYTLIVDNHPLCNFDDWPEIWLRP